MPTIDFATRYSTRYSDFLLQPYSNPTRSKKSLLVCAWWYTDALLRYGETDQPINWPGKVLNTLVCLIKLFQLSPVWNIFRSQRYFFSFHWLIESGIAVASHWVPQLYLLQHTHCIGRTSISRCNTSGLLVRANYCAGSRKQIAVRSQGSVEGNHPHPAPLNSL